MSIPIEIAEVYDGLAEATGLMRIARDPAGGDVLELELQTAWLGMFKRPTQVAAWPLSDIAEVRFKRGVFKDRLWLRPARLDLLDALPGRHKGRVKLKIKKVYRDEVYDLLDDLEAWRPEQVTEGA
ncbi:MAG: hypothetical protein AAF809_04580 [Bacteroidota bacterium]